MKPHSGNVAGLLLAGPLLFLLSLGCIAVVVLIAWGMHKQEALMLAGERARRRLERGRVLPMLWGLSATVLVVAVGGLLMQTHVLALLGLALWVAGLCLVGCGLAVAAWAVGEDLAPALGTAEDGILPPLRLGLWAFFLATWLPVAGGVMVLLLTAAGMGAILEVLLTREPAP